MNEIRHLLLPTRNGPVLIDTGCRNEATPVTDFKPVTFLVTDYPLTPGIEHRSSLAEKTFFIFYIKRNNTPLHHTNCKFFIFTIHINDGMFIKTMAHDMDPVEIQFQLRSRFKIRE